MRVVRRIDRDRLAARPRAASRPRSTAARSAPPSWPSARAGTCPTACRWPGWPGSTTTGPLYVAHGAGCRFTDVDGNAYVDFNQADLSATCGFAPPAVLDAIAERAARGLQFLLPVEEGDRRPPSCSPSATACPPGSSRSRPPAPTRRRSGSPATAPAASCIVVFGGHYHGHLDDTLVTGDERAAEPELLGVNPRAAADTRVVAVQRPARRARARARGAATSPP